MKTQSSDSRLTELAQAVVDCFSSNGEFNSFTAPYSTTELRRMAKEVLRPKRAKAERGTILNTESA